MTAYNMDMPLESSPAPLLQRGEFLPRVSKGSYLSQREGRRDLTAPATPATQGMTP